MDVDVGDRRLAAPSGHPPPTYAIVGKIRLDLSQMAQHVCGRYHQEFPDEFERYGREAAEAWCVHDVQHLLNWAAGAVNGHFEMIPQVEWLARVLAAREFPLDRLARGLDISADLVLAEVGGQTGAALAKVLKDAARYTRGDQALTAGTAAPTMRRSRRLGD